MFYNVALVARASVPRLGFGWGRLWAKWVLFPYAFMAGVQKWHFTGVERRSLALPFGDGHLGAFHSQGL